ncbi:MAG: transcription-repair coupling factor [Phyllobacteriaceae bacterium]|nr:transcription-repair coupling factor [Phyllobacteriaceae bacterium]
MLFSENLAAQIASEDRPLTFSGVPDGAVAALLAQLAKEQESGSGIAYVAADGQKLPEIAAGLAFFAPWLEVIELPAWDCLPYDRVSPSASATAGRVAALSRLAAVGEGRQPLVVLTTANALVQRCVPRAAMAGQVRHFLPGQSADMDGLVRWLEINGFERATTVRDRGEYAVRGGIVDLHTPGAGEPVRLDFFGDTLESVRSFDLASQRSTGQLKQLTLAPMSEVILDEASVSRFRSGYIAAFGAATRDDALYQAVSEGRRFAGTEHWLPLFYEKLETLGDYLSDFLTIADQAATESANHRIEQIEDHYQARRNVLDDNLEASLGGGAPYKPLAPQTLYLSGEEAASCLGGLTQVSPFAAAETSARAVRDLQGRPGRNFATERASGANVFDALVAHVGEEKARGQRVLLASWTEGSGDRMAKLLADHGLEALRGVDNLAALEELRPQLAGIAPLPTEHGFELPGLSVIAEQDVLGDRLVRRSKKRRASDFISEVASLSQGDIVVHVEHGIARFAGLTTIEAAGAPHDCLELRYAGDDRLFLPVENIELLSRYGAGDAEVQLDRLGGVAWQSRKAKLKKKLLEIAGQLIAIAAERALRNSEPLTPPEGLYGEFVARFPYDETEDQLAAIEAVLDDLAAGTPMDRLVCGDVGFGKTEVALRAAFVAAMAGKQVAVVVPTTLLARQHYKTFCDRFSGLPVKIAQASRLVSAGELAATRKGIADGTIDIVVGTHALLADSIRFDRLGLLIIDEEQRFGVKHKEKLKELRSDVHVLTLSATPIPRTLQLALTGVRELSLITTAPLDRLAVRTFVTPFDGLVIREALLREHYRGGQSFYVCPRVSDLEEQAQFLREHVPELKFATAHGQMAPGQLDDVMNAFYDGKYDVLLSTTIVESGLDIPTANTLIVHRADMFGLAQLYQLRGRVGRSKTRAYALFTLPVRKPLTPQAERRLKVLQSLDSIGAGFELASHDLDIRGSGNILGEEQSGHIREVGYELYQQMLEETVAELKQGEFAGAEERWSPQISVGASVMIPEDYVPDLQLRLSLYRRLADLDEAGEIDAFGAELIDRFGPLPEAVDHLLKVVFIKALCRKANIDKLDAGPKGLVVQFRNGEFSNPAELLKWISEQSSLAKVRPDQSLFLSREWETADKRIKGAAVIASKLAAMTTL